VTPDWVRRASVEYKDTSGVVIVGAEWLITGEIALYPEQMSAASGAPPIQDAAFRALVIARIRVIANFLGIQPA